MSLTCRFNHILYYTQLTNTNNVMHGRLIPTVNRHNAPQRRHETSQGVYR